MRIIPAIDIIEGKCVRLSQGDYSKKVVYNEDPLEVAREFEDNGINYLHLVDLDGAKSKHIVNYRVLEKIATKTKLEIDFGGGIKSEDDVRIAFESGAGQITGGSIAYQDPAEFFGWMEKYSPERIILGADVKEKKIAIQGWTEQTDQDIFSFIETYVLDGLSYVICTDIAEDGMLRGPNFELYRELKEHFTELNIIASGGVSSINDLWKLHEMKLNGAIVGKALYEGQILLSDLKSLL